MIHPSAIVDAKAELGTEVEIGPGVVIEGPVQIGSGTRIEAHAVLSGEVRIGQDNRIGYGAIIGSYPQDLSFEPKSRTGIQIGEKNVIREYATIHRGTKEGTLTVLGSNNLLMVGAHVGHNAQVGNGVILANNVLLGGYVEVRDRAFLGGGAVVHQFTRIGTTAILQGVAAVSKDIPPFCVAAGLNSVVAMNVVGLRRAGFSAALRQEVKDAFRLLYFAGLTTAQAISVARQRPWAKEIAIFWDFVEKSERGICSYTPWSKVKGREG